jgi:hypothetical protein
MTTNRRTVLATLGAVLLPAGCLGAPVDSRADRGNSTVSGDPPTEPSTATPGEPPTETPDGPPTGTPDQTPTPTSDRTPTTTPDGRFRDEPCPSFSGADRTVCAHTRPADAPVYLESSADVLRVDPEDAVETITFTLHNDTGGPVTLNPYAWAVHRKDGDGEWARVAPDVHVQPLVELPDGETYAWILSRRPHPTPEGDRTLYPTVDVGNGRHAFAVVGRVGPVGGDGDSGERVECVALFDVEGVGKNPEKPTATPTARPGRSGGDRIGD